MKNNDSQDRHFAGSFNIDGEEINGELIYNKERGITMLNLVKLLPSLSTGKRYSNLNVITGALYSGTIVTLFHNRCVNNHIHSFQTQYLTFVADYSVWSKTDVTQKTYNELVCVLENALGWSKLSVIDKSEFQVIKFCRENSEKIYHWFGATITFSTSLKCDLFSFPPKEESAVTERLVVHIESDKKKEASDFSSIRNKVISLISFAIKDNVNIEEQYLYDYDDSYQVGNQSYYDKYYLYTSERRLPILNREQREYNFTLEQLSPEKDIQLELDLLEPIFNLYLSLFKYTDMPPEMVFLNIVQALETFHARFFYNDSKEKYVASVAERFSSLPNYNEIEKLLLSETQKDTNCRYIILVSRLNDLLIGKNDGLFRDYYETDCEFAQTVADTRHYYTHYGKSKEKKALKGDKLIYAIRILSTLLEYNVCLQLGIDNQPKVRHFLSLIAPQK